jgi:p70 ribosomal S6 kinase
MGAIGDKHDLELAFEDLFEEPNNLAHNVEIEERTKTFSQTVPLNRVGLRDFKILKLVGKGAFGKVFQVEKIDTGIVYAMKVLRKDFIIKSGAVENIIAEREILRKIRHPFLVSLHYAFQTEEKLYLVMDFANGGQLFEHLKKEAVFLEDHARIYMAELVLAIEHLHKQDIIHRDLKPENILLDANVIFVFCCRFRSHSPNGFRLC